MTAAMAADHHGHWPAELPDGTGGDALVKLAQQMRDSFDSNNDLGSATWRHVLDDAVATAHAETDPALLREKLLEVRAVADAWVEAIDNRSGAA